LIQRAPGEILQVIRDAKAPATTSPGAFSHKRQRANPSNIRAHAASDRLRDSAVPPSVAFATSCGPCIIFWLSSLAWSPSTCACRLTKSV
jgi:hypothetical protein